MLPKVQSGEVHLLLGAFFQEAPDGLVTEKLLEVVTTAICCRSNPLARLDRVPPEALRDHLWVIYKRDTLMRERLTEYFLRFQMPSPQVVMEVDALAATMIVVAGTPYLTAAPTTLAPMAERADLAVLPLEVPLWSFPSGAWTRRSTREYPILRRALEILRELGRDHSAGLSRSPD
jgi:DNA-binding transcriptional LysR family regulator